VRGGTQVTQIFFTLQCTWHLLAGGGWGMESDCKESGLYSGAEKVHM